MQERRDSRSERRDRTPSARRGRRVAYTIAAGAAGACAPGEAEAQVTFRDVNIDLNQRAFINLYMDFDPYYDIRLENYVFNGGNYQGAYVLYETGGQNAGQAGAVVGFFANGNAYASALSVGDLIDATTTGGGPYDVSLSYGANNPNAEFSDVESAFIGVAFPIFDALHHGWIRVDIDNAAGVFDIRDLAFNFTPGAPILAGQIIDLSDGDYNDDGVVDAADYTVYRDTLGSTEDLRADGDGSGEVDPADFVVWTDEFGFSAFGDFTTVISTSATSVPEPGTLGLLAAGAAGVGVLRRRRTAASATKP